VFSFLDNLMDFTIALLELHWHSPGYVFPHSAMLGFSSTAFCPMSFMHFTDTVWIRAIFGSK